MADPRTGRFVPGEKAHNAGTSKYGVPRNDPNYQKLWKQANRDRLLAYAQDWVKAHPKEVQAYQRKSRQKHRVKVLRSRRDYEQALRRAAIQHYGGKCQCCGESTYEFLVFDHINGGGNRHRRGGRAGSTYRLLIKEGYPAGIRILCHNCNGARGCYGFCPHEKQGGLQLVQIS